MLLVGATVMSSILMEGRWIARLPHVIQNVTCIYILYSIQSFLRSAVGLRKKGISHLWQDISLYVHTHAHTKNTARRRVQRENTLYQSIKNGLFCSNYLATISINNMQGDCLVNILLTSFIKPAAKRSSPHSPLSPSLALSCTHISSRGLAGKGYRNSTLGYNQDHWSNSPSSIYTHIQFVRTLRGVSGEVFVWLDLSGTGPHGFS